jgi:hypothetical protein
MDYYRRKADSQIEIYRTRPCKRFIICTMAGYFPVLQKLANGTLAAIVRGGDLHVGERGWLGITTSIDGGESWSHVRVISNEGPDNRNPAFGQTSAGTLLLAYMKLDAYDNGEWQRGAPPRKLPPPFYLRRSSDGGCSWGKEERVYPIADATGLSPFGKIIGLPDGTLLMSLYGAAQDEAGVRAWVVRSTDDGRSWGDPSCIAHGFNETALVSLPSGKLIAMLRGDTSTPEDSVWQAESQDGGYSWSEPRPITDAKEHPADIIRLDSGRLLLTFSHRQPPHGVRALVSRDQGRTWELDQKITLVAESRNYDCGYPSSVQRDDGKILTAYYAYESLGPWEMWRTEFPVGIHAAAVLYDENDLP